MFNVAIAILAAGKSQRMGRPKQLMLWGGDSLIERALATALDAECGPVAVVLGAHQDAIEKLLVGRQCTILANPNFEQGMAASIRVATAHFFEQNDVDAILLMNCDQPKLSALHLRELCDRHARQFQSIVVTKFSGTYGSPALFDRKYFPELLELSGDRGAKLILQKHQEKIIQVPFEDAAFDLDRPADARLSRRSCRSRW
jgi:molybdenum cofactor cytidylyltransferase